MAKHHKTPHKPNNSNEDARQPTQEELSKTDPQENMQGPVSSLMQKVKEEVEENDEEDRREVREDQKKKE